MFAIITRDTKLVWNLPWDHLRPETYQAIRDDPTIISTSLARSQMDTAKWEEGVEIIHPGSEKACNKHVDCVLRSYLARRALAKQTKRRM